MKPYYQDSHVVIYCGDCCEILPHLQGSQMIFVDPPFNVGKKYGGSGDKRDNYYEWCEQWIDLCFLNLLDTGSLYLMLIPRHLEKIYPMLGPRGVFINEIHFCL